MQHIDVAKCQLVSGSGPPVLEAEFEPVLEEQLQLGQNTEQIVENPTLQIEEIIEELLEVAEAPAFLSVRIGKTAKVDARRCRRP